MAQLFARIEALYNDRDKSGLDAESKWLVERYYKDFVRAGARLSEADKTKLKAMNAELATLQTTFEQNVLKEKNASSTVVDDRADLAGLSDNEIAAASAAAKADGKEGKFVIRMLNTSGQPPLASLQNRPLREEDHANLAGPEQPWRRMGQQGSRYSHGEITRGTGGVARLPESCGLSTRRSNGQGCSDGEQAAGRYRAGRRGQRKERRR